MWVKEGWGWSCRGGVNQQGWGGVHHAVKLPKNDSLQNQYLTQPKSYLEEVQNLTF